MIQLSKSGGTVTFTFDENSGYLQNGTIDVPVNSLSLILDESDMATFRKSASNDIFVSALVGDFGMSKSELEAWYKENMVGSTGGGVDSGTVQTMIDEAVSGKIDSSSAVTDVKVLTVSQQNEVQIEEHKGGSTASTFVGTVYRVGSGLTWNYQTKEFAVDSSTIATKTDLASKQDTLTEGRAIDITNNTVSLDLPISAGTGTNSIREGSNTTASGVCSHAEGEMTRAYGDYGSHAEGSSTKAYGPYSHAEGNYTSALTEASHAEGDHTKATNKYEHASGRYNLSTSATTTFGDSGNTLFSVGNGTSNNARHNAFEIRQNGDIYLSLNGQDVKLQDQLGGKAVSGGTNISVTTGETADTINCTLPITINSNKTTILPNNGNNTGNGSYNFVGGRNCQIANYGGASYPDYAFCYGYNNTVTTEGEAAFGTYNQTKNASGAQGISGTTMFTIGNGNWTSRRHNALEVMMNGDIYIADTNDTSTTNWYEKPMIKLQDQLGGGEVSSAITSGDTNAVAGGAVYDKFDEVESVTAAALNVLNDKFDGLTLKKLTQAQYDALSPNYDNNTLYVII